MLWVSKMSSPSCNPLLGAWLTWTEVMAAIVKISSEQPNVCESSNYKHYNRVASARAFSG